MNTRRLTKKYKYKNRNKKTRRNRKSRRTRRRVMKGGLPSVSRASSRSSVVPRGFIVRSSRASSASVRPSDSAGISKHRDNFNFECFYNKLMNTPVDELEITLQHNKDMYIKNTTFQTFQPKGAYLNMTGLKFVNYLHGKYKSADNETKKKIRSIVSLFDQCNMSQGVRSDYDLASIKNQVHPTYFACYKKLYSQIYKKVFPCGNHNGNPLSTSAIVVGNLQTIKEEQEEEK